MFGDAIRRLRESRGWKQEVLAQRSGLKQGRIADLENNVNPNPTLRTVIKLARAFEISLDELVREAEK
jgi:transcriptional regulator with XRE-family HTH domain